MRPEQGQFVKKKKKKIVLAATKGLCEWKKWQRFAHMHIIMIEMIEKYKLLNTICI